MKTVGLLASLILGGRLLCALPASDEMSGKAVAPSVRDRCPVCGMFVTRYPDWVAQVTCKDGRVFFFDGAKDALKWLLLGRSRGDSYTCSEAASVLVTDYYSLKSIDAHSAWFVLGGDVLGPMGRELVPLDSREAAAEFLQDHHGERIIEFRQISPELVQGLN